MDTIKKLIVYLLLFLIIFGLLNLIKSYTFPVYCEFAFPGDCEKGKCEDPYLAENCALYGCRDAGDLVYLCYRVFDI